MSPTNAPPSPAASPDAAVAWDDALLRDPHAVADKQRRVRQMFAAIAPSYDLNNRVHSLWVDQYWRRKAVKLSDLKPTDRIVDVACGTGDLTIKYAAALYPIIIGTDRIGGRVLGIDYTFEMLSFGRKKWFDHPLISEHQPEIDDNGDLLEVNPGARGMVQWLNGDAQSLPLPDACADVVSIAFGIRNVADPAKAIREFFRVLRPGGRLIILEFSLPTNPVLRGLYNLYFRQVLPRTATLISGDKSGAYKYLPESVNTFIGRDQMTGMMSAAGFADVAPHPMTFGVCVCYRGVKR